MDRDRITEILKRTYQIDLELISESEFTKWISYLEGNPVIQSSTTDDEFVDFMTDLERRATKEANKVLINRSELSEILQDANIDSNIN